MVMTEVIRQAENPRHVATAQLGRGFADLPIELRRLLDYQDTRSRVLAFQHQRGRRAGKRAADNYDVVVKLHRRARMMDFGGGERNASR